MAREKFEERGSAGEREVWKKEKMHNNKRRERNRIKNIFLITLFATVNYWK